jgi:hypothetical protein
MGRWSGCGSRPGENLDGVRVLLIHDAGLYLQTLAEPLTSATSTVPPMPWRRVLECTRQKSNLVSAYQTAANAVWLSSGTYDGN